MGTIKKEQVRKRRSSSRTAVSQQLLVTDANTLSTALGLDSTFWNTDPMLLLNWDTTIQLMKLLERDFISHEEYPLVHRMMRVYNDFQTRLATSERNTHRGKGAAAVLEDERETSSGLFASRIVLPIETRRKATRTLNSHRLPQK